MRHLSIIASGLLLVGCSSTAPVLERTQWLSFSSEYPRGTILWHAPNSKTHAGFVYHAKRITTRDINDGKVYTLLWYKGYDVNSWGYTAFIMQIDLQKYPSKFDETPSMAMFRQERMHLWSDASHVVDEVTLGDHKWLKITVDHDDKLNDARYVMFQMPLDHECFLNVKAEYGNDERKNTEWFESRQAIFSNVVESIQVNCR